MTQSSLFGDDPALSWNLNKLDTILKRIDLPGVTRAMLYFGMWRAMFAFHTVRAFILDVVLLLPVVACSTL